MPSSGCTQPRSARGPCSVAERHCRGPLGTCSSRFCAPSGRSLFKSTPRRRAECSPCAQWRAAGDPPGPSQHRAPSAGRTRRQSTSGVSSRNTPGTGPRTAAPRAPGRGGDQSHPRCLRGRARTPQLSVHANYGTHCCRRRGPARSASRPFIEKSANPSSTPGVSKKAKTRPAM